MLNRFSLTAVCGRVVAGSALALGMISASAQTPSSTAVLADGYHNLVGVAWDQDGYSFGTPDLNLFIANEDHTIYTNSPQNGAVLTNPDVHFNVRTRWDYTLPNGYPGNRVTHVRVYVDNQDVYDTNANDLDFYKTFPSGGHTMEAIAWNGEGQYRKSYTTFSVK